MKRPRVAGTSSQAALTFMSDGTALGLPPWAAGLFLALKPAVPDGLRIYRHMTPWIRHLPGGRIPADRLHVTLAWLGPDKDLPHRLILTATEGLSSLAAACIDVSFDRLACFGSGAVVLRGRRSEPLHALRRMVLDRLPAAARPKHSFEPHMTVLYSPDNFPECGIEPVRWTAGEIVLVRSLTGRSRHVALTVWPLAGGPELPTPRDEAPPDLLDWDRGG